MTDLVVTGGRKYSRRDYVFAALDKVHAHYKFTRMINGGGGGADYLCRLWAISRRVLIEQFDPDWEDTEVEGAVIRYHSNGEAYNAAAGGIRNSAMVEAASDDAICVHFPGGAGTNDMLGKCMKAGIKCLAGEVLAKGI